MATDQQLIEQVTAILHNNRLASLATVGADGWPHCTMVGFANEGVRLYFLIARRSQKMEDLERDGRISIAIGHDVIDPASIRALAIQARAKPVVDEGERRSAMDRLYDRRPALRRLEEPSEEQSALIVGVPEQIRLLDYSKGYGYSTLLSFDSVGQLLASEDAYHDWGYGRR